MNDQDSYDLAEQLIDESIFRVSTGANQEEELITIFNQPKELYPITEH